MKNAKWIPALSAMLFAFPVFAHPLLMDEATSAEVKAEMFDNQVAEAGTASEALPQAVSASAQQTAGDSSAPVSVKSGSGDVVKTDPASPETEAQAASSEHAAAVTEHPEKPAAKPATRKAHSSKHGRKKAA